MATVTTTPPQLTMKVDLIDAHENARGLDREHVHSLAGSIALQGVLVPIVVRAAGERYELVAGFHRLAAVRELGPAVIDEIPVVIRDQQTEEADRAIENIARKALRPDEPGGIALDASFGPLDDAIASGLGRFPALAAIVG
jgi:ParB family chromosome partitioning protein